MNVSLAAPAGSGPTRAMEGAAAPSASSDSATIFRIVAGLVLLVGIAIRLRLFLEQRPFWVDECMLALNLRSRSLLELARPLDQDQAAPIMFLWLEKVVAICLGYSEWALRLIPFLAGIASLAVALSAFTACANRRIALIATALLAVHPQLAYYSQELKQYSVDILIAVALLWAATQAETVGRSRSRFWIWIGIAGLTPWMSHTGILLIPGVVTWLLVLGLSKRSRSLAIATLSGTAVFGASLLAEYLLILRHHAGNPLLTDYWAFAYPPRGAGLEGTLAWLVERVATALSDPFSLESPMKVVALAALGMGIISAARQRSPAAVIVPAAIGATLLAGIVRAYPPSGRLLLFLTPYLVLMVVWGVDSFTRILRQPAVAALVAAVLVVVIHFPALERMQRFVSVPWRLSRGDVRKSFETLLSRIEPEDTVYVYYASGPTLLWYRERPSYCALRDHPTLWGSVVRDGDWSTAEDFDRIREARRCWLVFSHVLDPAELDRFRSRLEALQGSITEYPCAASEMETIGPAVWFVEFDAVD